MFVDYIIFELHTMYDARCGLLMHFSRNKRRVSSWRIPVYKVSGLLVGHSSNFTPLPPQFCQHRLFTLRLMPATFLMLLFLYLWPLTLLCGHDRHTFDATDTISMMFTQDAMFSPLRFMPSENMWRVRLTYELFDADEWMAPLIFSAHLWRYGQLVYAIL